MSGYIIGCFFENDKGIVSKRMNIGTACLLFEKLGFGRGTELWLRHECGKGNEAGKRMYVIKIKVDQLRKMLSGPNRVYCSSR